MHDQLPALYSLLGSDSMTEVQRVGNRIVNDLGFDNWMYASASAPSRPTIQLNAYPRDWIEHYERRGYFDVDPVVGHCRTQTVPCLWASTAQARSGGFPIEFFREAADFGLRAGVGLPVHGPGGQSAMVSVATDDRHARPPDFARLSQLHLLATFMHEAGHRIAAKSAHEPAHLTARELDCLRWAAEGKTSWEIGQLLGIGERTIVFHLQNAARKLGVIGRRQAVARAISLQLIAL